MSRWWRWLAVVGMVAATTHVMLVWTLPRAIMSVVIERVSSEQGVNTVFHQARASAGVRGVVRPSPDLNYSGCLLDVSNGPVRISVPVSEPYTSVSVFSASTDNVYARNDQQSRGGRIVVRVASADYAAGDVAGATDGVPLVRLHSDHGLALVRRVIEDDAHNRELNRIRQDTTCLQEEMAK